MIYNKPMNNANYEQALHDLRNHHVVITPNNRLAKTLLEDYLHTSSQSVIEKPNCLSYDAFLQQLYFKLTHHTPNPTHPLLLTPQQARYLWTQQLSLQLGTVHQGLINKAYDAWARCQLWQIDTSQQQFTLTEQTTQFSQWSRTFSLKLKELNLITHEMLVPYLLKQQIPDLPSHMTWFCFDEYTPQQIALQDYFSSQGIQNQTLELAPRDSQLFLFDASDDSQESLTLVQWLKQQLTLNKKRIGVVVPELNQKANSLNRLLQQHFPTETFNISLGKTLSDYALVSHALCWISLNKRILTQEDAALLLTSPFLIESNNEFIARAQFLQTNPVLQERIIDYPLFVKELMRSAPLLSTALQTIAHYPKQASILTWVTLFQERLAALGFPGDSALDSGNYQCYQRLLLLFDELKQLSLLTTTLTSSEAFAILTDLTTQTIFQPEKLAAAPIHVLGLLEAAGCPFDALWVGGLTDECLPQKTQFNPFIPIGMQKELGLPYTSPEKEFNLANHTLSRFKQATPCIIFSYPKYTDDKSNLPSPLLTDLIPIDFQNFINSVSAEEIDQQVIYQETYHLPLDSTLPHSANTALLANQAKCPFRAFSAHRLHLKGKLETTEGPNARERGTMIHKIMELFWLKVKDQHTLLSLDEDALALIIDEAIEKTISPYQKQRKYSFPSLIQTVERRRLKQLVDALLIWERERPDFNVTALEENYSFTLAKMQFDVRIDRLDTVENNQKWVIDYKTTLPQKTPWQEDRPSEPQILLYALLDEQINTLLFLELKNGQVACKGFSEEDSELTGVKTIQEKESWQTLRGQWHQQLTSLAEEFQQGICSPTPISPAICAQCDFPDLCRLPFKD